MEIPETMRAMLLEVPGEPLKPSTVPVPQPGPDQVLIQVSACGVCRTDLHILVGELSEPKLPLILGHQIAGRTVQIGANVERVELGDRVGVPWLGYTDGSCRYCRRNCSSNSVFQ